jgi:hypothetical protein
MFNMTRTLRLASGVTALMLATAVVLLSVPGRTASFYYEVQPLASRVEPAVNALSASIAGHPAEIIPP